MSHQIEIFKDGSGSFISQGTRGWHLLGEFKPEGYLNVDEMIVGGRLHQEIFKRPLKVSVEMDGVVVDETEVGSQVASCRMHPDTGELQVLGVIGKDATIWQPRESFEFGQTLLDSGQAIGVSAGSLFEGKVSFACFKIPTEVKIGGVDVVDFYLSVLDSYDGSYKYTAFASPIRSECWNTVCMGLANAMRVWKLKHTKNAELNVEQARKALGITTAYMTSFQTMADKLITKKMTKAAFDKIITAEFGPGEEPSDRQGKLWDTKRDRLLYLFSQADTQANIRGTAWAGYNAVVEYLDWELEVRGMGKNEENNIAQNRARFTRSFTGLDKAGSVDEAKLSFQKRLLATVK